MQCLAARRQTLPARPAHLLLEKHYVILYGFRMNYDSLTEKRERIESYRPMPPELVQNLEQWFKVELTYTSNALEGNTLTRRETAVVVEKGLTVGGKSLVEHLEATNHAAAYEKILALVERENKGFSESDIMTIHETILTGIDDDNAGRYRNIPVRISGAEVIFPNPIKVPDLMAEFILEANKHRKLHPVEMAAEAHYQLVTVHPFVDGNGRTARLLMNLLLLQQGYPPALIRKRDRLKYIGSLEEAQLGGSKEKFYKIIAQAVNRSCDIYLEALTGEASTQAEGKLMKIGQLAKHVGETVVTIRYWTKEGLLSVADKSASGYQLYGEDAVERVAEIRKLQSERYTIAEIKQKIG